MQTVDSQMCEVESNVWQALLWIPQFRGESVAVESAIATVYFPEEGTDSASEVILGPEHLISLPGNTYKLSFNTNYWKTGLYKVVFSGKYEEPVGVENIVVKEIDFELMAVSRVQYFIHQLIASLMDHPKMYQLDRDRSTGQSARYWSNQDYFAYLKRALDRFNSLPPTPTGYTFDDIPVEDILLVGAQVYALEARGRIEISNLITYSDGISLTINRVGYYQQEAARLRTLFDTDVKRWKLINRPGIRWVRKMWIPFRYRILSFHPLFKNIVWAFIVFIT